MTTYASLIRHGLTAVGAGDHAAGLRFYDEAFHIAANSSEKAAALQGKGVALRHAGEIDSSENMLIAAHDLARQDPILAARIASDISRTIRERASRLEASGRFLESNAQKDDAETWRDTSQKELLRSAIAASSIGRSLFEHGERQEAIVALRTAHHALTGEDDVHELENLVRLARASLLDRWRYARRSLVLASTTNDTKAKREYLVILALGNSFYSWLEDKYRKR